MVLMIKLYDLNSTSRATQYQRVETAILSYVKGAKDRYSKFDAYTYAIVVLAEWSSYEKIFELTSGPKGTKTLVHETSIRILQQM